MADILRIVSLPDRGRRRPVTLRDIGDRVNYVPTRDSWQYSGPTPQPSSVISSRTWGGSTQVGTANQNGVAQRSIVVRGANGDDCLAKIEAVISETRDFAGKFVEWRPDGASYSIFLELRGVATWSSQYTWTQFFGAKSVEIALQFPVAPLGRGHACDFIEDWSGASPLSDYTDRVAVNAVQVLAGQLVATGSLTTLRRLMFTGRGYLDRDATREASFIWGSTLTNQVAGVVVHELDSNNRVQAWVDDNGTNSRVLLNTVVAGGVVTSVTPVNLPSRLVAGQQIWVRGRGEGYVATAEVFTSQPGPSATPVATVNTLLVTTGEKAIVDSGGRGGIIWTPQNANAAVVSYVSRPWSWKGRALPEAQTLRGIPGTGPPLMDIELTPSGGVATPIFALLGWARNPGVYNLIWNGDLTDDASGWTNSGLGVTAGATVTRSSAGGPRQNGPYLQVVTDSTATTNQGAAFRVYRRFRRGVVYTLDFAHWIAAGSWELGVRSSSDVSLTTQAAAGSWTRNQIVTFTPTADVDFVDVFIRRPLGSSIAQTARLGLVCLYEGTVAPTVNDHALGKGAQPPLGFVRAASDRPADRSAFATASDANYLGGFGLKVTTAGVGSATASWLIDPSLVSSDEFTPGEVHLEVWLDYELAVGVVNPRVVISALPETGTGVARYLSETGAAGRAPVRPSAGTVKRFSRLGVLRLPTADRARWKLRLDAFWAALSTGTLGVDYLVLVPARRRAASPSGKTNDASYPNFTASTAEFTRRILTDLSSWTTKEPGVGPYSDTGLGGSVLEGPMPPAGQSQQDLVLIGKLSNLAPDDPAVDATTEQLSHAVTEHASITPTYYLARPS